VDSSLECAVEQSEDTLSDDVMTQLSSSLEVTMCELAACKDCCDEAQNQLAKLSGLPTKELNKTCMHALSSSNIKTSIIGTLLVGSRLSDLWNLLVRVPIGSCIICLLVILLR